MEISLDLEEERNWEWNWDAGIISDRNLDIEEELYAYFINWQKAFDRVKWTKLMQILKWIVIFFYVLSQPVQGTASYRRDDTRGCIIKFWPPDEEHMVLETCRGMK